MRNSADVTKYKSALNTETGKWVKEKQELFVSSAGAGALGSGIMLSKETNQKTGLVKWKNKYSFGFFSYESESSNWWGFKNYKSKIVISGSFGGSLIRGKKIKATGGVWVIK